MKSDVTEQNRKKIVWGIVLIVLGILLLIGLSKFGSILSILLIYPWVMSKITGISSDSYLARIIAVPAAIAIGLTFWQLILGNKKKRILGILIIGLIIILHSFAMIVVGQGEHPLIEELAAFRGSLPVFWAIPAIALVVVGFLIYRVISVEEPLISVRGYIGIMFILGALFLILAFLSYGLIKSNLGVLFTVTIELIIYCGLGLLFYGKYVKQES